LSLIQKIVKHYDPTYAGEDKVICSFHKERTPSLNVYKDQNTFYCFSGDTRIITKRGVVEIAKTVNSMVDIVNGEGLWQTVPISYFGEQEIVELHLVRNHTKKVVRTTANHDWYRRGRATPVKTVDLKSGDRLLTGKIERSFDSPSNEGIIHGICFGDGTDQQGHSVAYLYGDKVNDLSYVFGDKKYSEYIIKDGLLQRLYRLGKKNLKCLPDINLDNNYLAGFIAGYIATDGHVAKDGTVCLNSSDKYALEVVRDICNKLGIRTYHITNQDRLGYNEFETKIYRIHFVNEDLQSNMILRKVANERFNTHNKKFDRLRWVVESVVPTGIIEPVYCATVEGSHKFMLEDHIVTGNCFGCGAGSSIIDYVGYQKGYNPSSWEPGEFVECRDEAMSILGMTYEQFNVEKEKVSEGQVQVSDCLGAMTEDDIKGLMQKANKIIKGQKVHWYQGLGYRSIKDEYLKKYGHITMKDDEGNIISRHYPETNTKGKIAGYKCRNHPKDFTHGNVGNTGGKNQLSGQAVFKGYNKYLLIVGGEEDKVAAYQMLEDNRAGRGGIAEVHVVSPTCGENSAAKQVASNYAFCDMYEQIIIGMDNDEPGRKAAEAIAAVLPKEKVKIAIWTGKDPNKMLEDGTKSQAQFTRDFYNAKPLITSGIAESTGLMDQVRDELTRPKIKLPPEWKDVEDAMKGGIRQGSIVNIVGDTSVGKSTIVNRLNYFWMFNAPEKVGIASLEATSGQYALDMLSLHLEKNLLWIGEGEDILAYLDRPDVKSLYDNLLTDEVGQPRFSILDERDGDINMLERQIEKLIHQHGCRIIVIDVLTDILRGMSSDMQESHMQKQKQWVKTGVTIINVLHTRKPAGGDGTWKKASEYDAFGSSSFVQSAAYNIVISRNKMAQDPIERNTTHVDLPKCRGGETGEIMQLLYDTETRMMININDYFAKQVTHEQAESESEQEVVGHLSDGPPDVVEPEPYDQSVPF
jgi:archaellum biogenesis ATPase FlaH